MNTLRVLEGRERYELIHLIAEGGMGTVFKARKIGVAGFEKVVAIKMMRNKFSDSEAYVRNFISEAKLVANLIHENIVQIYHLDRFNDVYYFVIEYVDGVSLYEFIDFHAKLKKRTPLDLAVFIAARVARGLAYAHSRRGPDGMSPASSHSWRRSRRGSRRWISGRTSMRSESSSSTWYRAKWRAM